MAARPDPEGAWLATLSNAHRMLDDIPATAVAMEAPAGLYPSNGDLAVKRIRLYRVAGSPGFPENPGRPAVVLAHMAKWYWDRMAGIYLDGRRYDLALATTQKAAAAEGTAERWETAGNIAFHLHFFTESRDAYRHAAALSDAG